MPIGFISSQLGQRKRLPTGEVTFLLTDIEGSTGLLAALDDDYAGLLDGIRRLVRAAVRSPGGHEVSARGDDVFAAFEEPASALEAAFAIQRGMRDASWPGGRDVRLRIGLHRGRPQLTDVGYVGLSVHAAARICFAAHGGQTIMSAAVRSALPDPSVATGPRLLAVQGAARADRDLPGGGARPAVGVPAAALGGAGVHVSRYDDELWELVPDDPGPPPEHLREFVRSLGRVDRALDLGCGDGRLTADLQAAELTGADVSPVALGRARGRLPEARLVELEPDAPLPFGDGEFDLVLLAETLEHVRDVQLLLSEARRVLRPGGTLAVTTPATRPLMRAPDPLSPHLRFFTRRSLARLLDELGFDVRSLERRGGSLLARATR